MSWNEAYRRSYKKSNSRIPGARLSLGARRIQVMRATRSRFPFAPGAALVCLAATLFALSGSRAALAQGTTAPITFEKHVAPIVAKCRPCHFPGGLLYAKLPFDRAETIRSLGTKLFTRIKDEKEQAILRRFLEPKAEKK